MEKSSSKGRIMCQSDQPEKPEASTRDAGQMELSCRESSEETAKIKAVIEAILFASAEPVTAGQLHFFLKENFLINRHGIENIIKEIDDEYKNTGRSFEIHNSAGGYQVRTRPEFAQDIKKFLKISGHEKLSNAALETLAIIAYKQPLTRAEVEKIRGVNVDGVMRSLIEKDLIYASSQKDIPGKPWQYSTTKTFLATFGIKSLQELPPLGEQNKN